MKVAVMQPYFIPYAGYFRLFATAEVVVMFDCVQFPRRGWVHRNRLPLVSGETDWLTLPIAKAPQDTRISDLRFAADARSRLTAAAARFPVFARALHERNALAERILELETADVTAYLIALIAETTAGLGLERPVIRSSSLPIPENLHAQDRVIAILKHLDATSYVNPSGGRDLYDHATFDAAGIELGFLTPYGGPMESIFTRLLDEPAANIAAEIRRECTIAA
jgi:WbqC-like protein family